MRLIYFRAKIQRTPRKIKDDRKYKKTGIKPLRILEGISEFCVGKIPTCDLLLFYLYKFKVISFYEEVRSSEFNVLLLTYSGWAYKMFLLQFQRILIS